MHFNTYWTPDRHVKSCNILCVKSEKLVSFWWNVIQKAPSLVLHYSDVIMDAMASQITRVSKRISLKSERKQNLLLRKCMRRCLRSIGLFCLLNRLCGCRSKKASKLHVTGPCAGNSPGTGEFPAQMASYAENVSIWWRHHVFILRLHDTIRDIPSFNILVLRNALLKEKTFIIIIRILKALRLLNANTFKLCKPY